MRYQRSNLGQSDPCGREMDTEIATLEQYQANKRLPPSVMPPAVVEGMRLQYENAKSQREACHFRLGRGANAPASLGPGTVDAPVVQPGRNALETVKNIRTEAARRGAAGNAKAAERLRATADTIIDEAGARMIRDSEKERLKQQIIIGLCITSGLLLFAVFYKKSNLAKKQRNHSKINQK